MTVPLTISRTASANAVNATVKHSVNPRPRGSTPNDSTADRNARGHLAANASNAARSYPIGESRINSRTSPPVATSSRIRDDFHNRPTFNTSTSGQYTAYTVAVAGRLTVRSSFPCASPHGSAPAPPHASPTPSSTARNRPGGCSVARTTRTPGPSHAVDRSHAGSAPPSPAPPPSACTPHPPSGRHPATH